MPGSTGAEGANGNNSGTHTEAESHPWTRLIPDHPPRTDTPAYLAARKRMNDLVRTIKSFFYDAKDTVDAAGRRRYEDHHGGGLWLKDDQGWFLVRNLAGMEWSSQFCADPGKVDALRQTAQRLYARFPEAAAELGIQPLLDHPITTAADVAKWTDSICNASVPLSMDEHRGVLPTAGGIHHYPAPVAEIAFFKYDDFQLWVTDDTGAAAAVTPVGRRGSGDGRTRVVAAEPGTTLHQKLAKAWRKKRPVILPANDRASEEAFGEQYAKLATDSVEPGDPLGKSRLPSG
jgi:Family of unknown function (DUF6424)